MERKGVLRVIVMVVLDLALLFLATYLADYIVYGKLDVIFSESPLQYAIVFATNAVVLVTMFFLMRIYTVVLKYIGIFEAVKISMSFAVALIVDLVLMIVFPIINLRVILCSLLFDYCAVIASRFVYRMFVYLLQKTGNNHESAKGERVLIVGAGDAGVSGSRL